MKKNHKFVLFFVFVLSTVSAFAQESQLDKGIELYRQGKYKESVSVLENLSKSNLKTDAKVWNYLGLAYVESGDAKKGLKALEKAVKLSPNNSDFRTNLAFAYLVNRKINKAQEQVDKAIELNPQNVAAYYLRGTARLWERKYDEALNDADKIVSMDANYSDGYTLKANTLIAQFGSRIAKGATAKQESGLLKTAVETLEFCVANCQNNKNLEDQKVKLRAFKAFAEFFTREKTDSLAQNAIPEENSTPIKITVKPRPRYTDQARQANIKGTILIAVMFGENGQIQQSMVLKPLGYGLDEEALKASRRITFEPATKDGKPIPVVKTIEYSFNIY